MTDQEATTIILRLEHALKQSSAETVNDVPREVLIRLLVAWSRTSAMEADIADLQSIHRQLAEAREENNDLCEGMNKVLDAHGVKWGDNTTYAGCLEAALARAEAAEAKLARAREAFQQIGAERESLNRARDIAKLALAEMDKETA